MEIAKNLKLDLPATNMNTFELHIFIKSNVHPLAPSRQCLTIDKRFFNFKSALFLPKLIFPTLYITWLIFPKSFRLISYIWKTEKKRKTNVCSDISTWFHLHFKEAYSEPCQQLMLELSAKIIDDWKPLNISANHSVLDVWQGSECATVLPYFMLQFLQNVLYRISFQKSIGLRSPRKQPVSRRQGFFITRTFSIFFVSELLLT